MAAGGENSGADVFEASETNTRDYTKSQVEDTPLTMWAFAKEALLVGQ